MKMTLRLVLLLGLALSLRAAETWREITRPTVAEAAAAFPGPPREYGTIHWAIWGGPQTREKILADLERLEAGGTYVVMINASRGLQPKYFSPEFLDLIKFTVAECKRRGMKVWLEDDAGYPSGMAGGLISAEHPELGMQALVADARYSVAAGQTLMIPVPPDTVGILASTRQSRRTVVLPLPADGRLVWTAPNPGQSEVVFVRHVYRSSPTRYVNRADGTYDKDSLYSLIDYLDPEATRTYLHLIHETYEKIVGDELGKTILGFRGDEPDYTGFMPWTPKLLATFQRIKGYDLQPYLAQFFAPAFTPEVLRAKADYWDVWSAMFSENFFKPQEDWCKARHMEYMVHLNHEELMLDLSRGEDLIRNEGSFFRAMHYVGVPGVDNLNQIGPGIVADFPKLAASAAHVYGRPQVWNEEGGGLNQAGKFVADYNFVRGVNFLQIRGLTNPPGDNPAMPDPAAAIAWYVNRASYLLASGRPAAQVALFHPTDSLWLGDQEADDVTVKLVTELLEHQIDFDQIDADSLATVCTLEGGGLRNLSGSVYRAVIVPTSTVIDERVLARLRAFAAAGGKVVFVGRTPTLVAGRTFLHATEGAPDLGFATLEPTPAITDRVVAALPAPDVKLDAPCAPLKYIHRALKDGDVYFFFNESAQAQARTATLAGTGPVQVWDATTGEIHPLAGAAPAAGTVAVPLTLAPQEARFIVIGALPPGAAAPFPDPTRGQPLADLGGDWSVTLGDQAVNSPLKPVADIGKLPPAGTVGYQRTFNLGALPAGRSAWLDLGDVHEIARVTLNGVEFKPQPWPPYRWDITAALKPGDNTLAIQVVVPPAAPMRGFGGPRPGVTAPADAGPRGFAPTGVPGGLGSEPAGRERGGPGGRSAAPPVAPAIPSVAGLLGPVRLYTN